MNTKSITRLIKLLLVTLLLVPLLGNAQSAQEIIQEFQELMLERYVYLDKAQEVNAHLDKLLEEAHFDAFETPTELAMALTTQIRKITGDNHLSVRPPWQEAPQAEQEEIDPLAGLARYNPSMVNGFQYFEDNVGYFDMRYFGGGAANLGQLDEAMQKLSKADALIIDLRYSLGGSPNTVQYLCSYFFDQERLLSSIYSRHNDQTREYRTVPVNGQKRPRVPVFILTSDRSFSAAEDFPYTMQAHHRAIIVGEVTRGGAHPTRSHDLPGGFRASIPFARSINPVTQSNWEGTGIIPNVEVPEDQALAKAKVLATEAAAAYKKEIFAPILKALDEVEEGRASSREEQTVYGHLKKLVAKQIFTESDINRLGYNYFLGGKKDAASIIFKTNTQLFPNSANAFDSYAEILGEMGQRENALRTYKKAVALAKAQNHRNLAAFEQNLAAFERK